ncbi:MAG: hypothetical protein ACQEXJ_04780 [Myxococcota bacterium]
MDARRSTAVLGLALVVVATVGCEGPADVVTSAAEAARGGDHEAYAACFTPRSRPILRALWRTAERVAPDAAGLGAGDVAVGDVKGLSPDEHDRRRAVVTVQEGGRSLPVVLHSLAGAWRIDLMDTERVSMGLGGRGRGGSQGGP